MPFLHPENEKRANWATGPLNVFVATVSTGPQFAAMGQADKADMIGDLIGNLLHFAQREGLDAMAIVRLATQHYQYEAATDYVGD